MDSYIIHPQIKSLRIIDFKTSSEIIELHIGDTIKMKLRSKDIIGVIHDFTIDNGFDFLEYSVDLETESGRAWYDITDELIKIEKL